MTPDQADVHVLQTMVDTMVGMPKFSYAARQRGAKKPTGEFAHIRLLEEYQEGIPSQRILSQTDVSTTFRTSGLVKLRFRIGVVDTDGIPSSKIMNGWTSEDMKALMITLGYGFIRCTPLSTEDGKLEKEWEYRKGFSVEFYTTRVFEETVDNIGRVIAVGKFITPQFDELLINIDTNNIIL